MQLVGLNPQVAFQAKQAENKTDVNATVNTKTAPTPDDSFEKTEHKKTFKEGLGSVAKFFVNMKEMAVGIVKGLLYVLLSFGLSIAALAAGVMFAKQF